MPPAPDVAVVGLWHLGSVASAGWALSDRRVVASDPDIELRSRLAAGHAPVYEPGLEDALRLTFERGTLRVADDVAEAITQARVTYLAYDTMVDASGRAADPRLESAVQSFVANAHDGALLIVSSQVTVGTSRTWRELLNAQGRGLLIACVPENLRLGRALEDFLRPDRLLIGADDGESWEAASVALAPFHPAPMRLSLASAEMAKHATNAYLAMCIAFANDLAWLALAAGADPSEVAAGLRADPRVSPTAPLRPGSAFSGSTLARDLNALRDLGEKCGRAELFAAVAETNERHAAVALTWLEDALGSLEGARIAVAGLTYKAGTSTLRGSLPVRVVELLLDRGATVTAWDPTADELAVMPRLSRTKSLEECVREADALVVLTGLPELAAVDWNTLRPGGRFVVDACMGVDRRAVEAAGWVYRGFATG
jgi:UDPglucose 6-dehydrogenase